MSYSVNAEDIRTQCVANALAEWNANPDKRRWPVPWRGGIEHFELVRVELDNLALNPNSHRIKAQLEGLAGAEAVAAQPDSAESQELIELAIFMASPHFSELQDSLDRDGQKTPGITTRAGVLINGNRRAVALHDLGEKWMDVAVLPPGVGEEAQDDLEWDLQITTEHLEEYTFTNVLMVINERIEKRRESPQDLALKLGWARSRDPAQLRIGERFVARAVKIYASVRSLQELSKISGARLPLTYFDDKQQALEELEDLISRLEDDDAQADEIASVRRLRTVGLLSGLTKMQLRAIKGGFQEDYLDARLSDDDADNVRPLLVSGEAGPPPPGGIPGLDAGAGSGDAASPADDYLTLLAQSVAIDESDNPNGVGAPITAEVREKIEEVLSDAVDVATHSANRTSKLIAPLASLRKARKSVQQARSQWAKVRADEAFSASKFEYELNRLAREAANLHADYDRSDPPSDDA